MMHKAVCAVLPIILLGGCGDRKEPQAKAIDDAQAVAMVERMNQTPLKPIVPQPLTAQDIARYGLSRDGCSFRQGGKSNDAPLFVAQRDRGFLKIDGVLQTVAAKSGSAELPSGALSTYVGLDGWIELVAQAGDQSTEHLVEQTWPSRLVIHDAQQRVSFDATGLVRCSGSDADG